jgi:microcystin-dependent protein
MADRRRNLGIPSGVVFPFAGNTAPYGYLICDGRAVSRTEYASLFMMIGTSHGIGDGSTTFNLPDYRGNFLRGKVDVTTITGSGTVASNNATFTNHGINRTGFKVRLSSGTLSGLATSTDYFAIVVDDNTLAFASSFANAIAGTKIAITGANSAVITQFEDPDASSRTAATVGGNSAGGLGSIQAESMASHNHGSNFIRTGVYQGTLAAGSGYQLQLLPSDSVGGNETRPKNSLVNYIIKV